MFLFSKGNYIFINSIQPFYLHLKNMIYFVFSRLILKVLQSTTLTFLKPPPRELVYYLFE